MDKADKDPEHIDSYEKQDNTRTSWVWDREHSNRNNNNERLKRDKINNKLRLWEME